MKTYFYFIKPNLLKQIRNYRFLLIVAISIFLGILCVPAGEAGYEVIYLGGVRGTYNSAWLGGIGVLLPAILLWLPGFYLLRSQISEDSHLKVGDIIASTPISRFSYVSGKALANFVVLITLVLFFLFALAGMQFVRHENMQIIVGQYVLPFLFITIPYLFVLASLTVLFDVLPGFKGVFGNIVIFGIWIALISTSAMAQKSELDLLGIGTILAGMMKGAHNVFPEIHTNMGSLGFNITNGITPTFAWSGMTWSIEFLASRFVWLGAALLIIFLSSCLFDRFKKTSIAPLRSVTTISVQFSLSGIEAKKPLSPVFVQNFKLLYAIKGELKIMLSTCSAWWYLATCSCVVLSFIVPYKSSYHFISLIMLLPIPIWAQMGCREKYYFTAELVQSSCSLLHKRMAEWLAGLGITLFVSLGILLHLVILSEWNDLIAWIVGSIFISTLALTLGCLGGNRKLFEAVYITWFYFGPLNGTAVLDFWGMSNNSASLYFILSCVLIVFTYVYIWNTEKHILNIISNGRL